MPKKKEEKEKAFTLVGERLRLLRETKTTGEKRMHMSQDELGEALNLSKPTIGRYERDNPTLGLSTLEHIAKFFNTTVAYLTGATDIKDPLLYYQEEMRIEDKALDAYETECRVKVERIKALFELCGYSYENVEGTAEYDFDGLQGEQFFPGPHKLTDPAGLNDTIYLSDDELENIKRLLGDAVAFECFRIKRGRDKKDGNG